MKLLRYIVLILVAGAGMMSGAALPGSEALTEYVDQEAGFSFRHPVYWVLTTDVDEMLAAIDGPIDLIREEELTESERERYRALVHVDGSPRYLSNIAVLVHPHQSGRGPAFETSEEAAQAVANDFDRTIASGTYFLEETYLGESHTFVYRRREPVEAWGDSIRITYHLTASRTHAYLLVETILLHAIDAVYQNQFNQVIQSFRVRANESGMIDPSLDWGAFKPGEDPSVSEPETDIGRIEIREDFHNNAFGWPVGDDARLRDGRYELDSTGGYPFTVTSTALGQIAFDFSYEGEVEFLDGDESAAYGLVFAYRDEDNYFAFLVTQSGLYLVVEERDGVVTEIIPWSFSPVSYGERHTLMVQGNYQTVANPDVAHRYELVFMIDGTKIDMAVMEHVLDVSGWYGLFVSENLHVAFDSLVSRNYLIDSLETLERVEY